MFCERWAKITISSRILFLFCNFFILELFQTLAQVEVARPKWPLIKPSLSAHIISVRSNYMVWRRLRTHFCLDNGLDLVWSEITSVWDGLTRGSFERKLVWSEANSSEFFFHFFCFCFAYLGCLSQEYTIQTHSDQRPCWSETKVDQKQEAQLIATAGPLLKRLGLTVDQDIIM